MLEIKKTGVKNFTHYWITPNKTFKYEASDLTVISNDDITYLRSLSGRIIFERKGFVLTNIRVYDVGGSAETFATTTALHQRLIDLGYPAYYVDGEIVLSNIISDDASNNLSIGTDGGLFVSPTGGVGVDSVNGQIGTVVLSADDIPTGATHQITTILQVSQIASNLSEIETNTDEITLLQTDKADLSYVNLIKPIQTADTSSVISLAYIGGNYCNMTSANTNTTYTTTGAVLGGNAVVLINVATEPTITGATKISGSDFEPSIDMEMYVRNNGTITQYFFNKL